MDQEHIDEWWRIVQIQVKICPEKSEIVKNGSKSREEDKIYE
jgi:hypothetical protein